LGQTAFSGQADRQTVKGFYSMKKLLATLLLAAFFGVTATAAYAGNNQGQNNDNQGQNNNSQGQNQQ
jgi:hypothetical protein